VNNKLKTLELVRAVSLDIINVYTALMLFQRLSPNLKCKKFAKKFKIEISKICFTVFFALANTSCAPSFMRIRQKV